MAADPRDTVISLSNLSRTYKVVERETGLRGALRSLVKRKWKTIEAVRDVSFSLRRGEIVGFLGPNGAGKTTTIKVLAGLLFPTQGEVSVLGHTPYQRKAEFLRSISLIMGRRDQLIWDIPAMDSYEFFRVVFGIPREDYRRTLDDLVSLFGIGHVLNKPVRNLSLGERMKCELVGALLHKPQVLFLDEPTIGLDVLAQQSFREFIKQYNRLYDATVVLTSHYMGDVDALCNRVLFIDQGRLTYEGDISSLIRQFLPYKHLSIKLSDDRGREFLDSIGEIVEEGKDKVTVRVASKRIGEVLGELIARVPLEDVTIVDPPTTELIKYVYQQGSRLNAA
jgi:ABC-2 type transport system ATP-binding protein